MPTIPQDPASHPKNAANGRYVVRAYSPHELRGFDSPSVGYARAAEEAERLQSHSMHAQALMLEAATDAMAAAAHHRQPSARALVLAYDSDDSQSRLRYRAVLDDQGNEVAMSDGHALEIEDAVNGFASSFESIDETDDAFDWTDPDEDVFKISLTGHGEPAAASRRRLDAAVLDWRACRTELTKLRHQARQSAIAGIAQTVRAHQPSVRTVLFHLTADESGIGNLILLNADGAEHAVSRGAERTLAAKMAPFARAFASNGEYSIPESGCVIDLDSVFDEAASPAP